MENICVVYFTQKKKIVMVALEWKWLAVGEGYNTELTIDNDKKEKIQPFYTFIILVIYVITHQIRI